MINMPWFPPRIVRRRINIFSKKNKKRPFRISLNSYSWKARLNNSKWLKKNIVFLLTVKAETVTHRIALRICCIWRIKTIFEDYRHSHKNNYLISFDIIFFRALYCTPTPKRNSYHSAIKFVFTYFQPLFIKAKVTNV